MKEKIALVTDSTSDLPAETLHKLDISFFPLKIIYSDRQYKDRVDITPGEVYQRFEEEIPTTSLPSPGEVEARYNELKEQGFTHVIAIHISGGLSSTCNTSQMVGEQIEGLTVEVIDSKRLSMGLGRLVLYARKLIDDGELDFKEIVNQVRAKIDEVSLYFVVGTLKYLIEGGRIGKVRGKLGQLLNIKPIISIDEDGEYYTFERARSRKKSINKLFELTREKIKEGICYVDVMHANAEEEARALLERLKSLSNVTETFFGEISPAMAVHAGPGLIGVCVTKK